MPQHGAGVVIGVADTLAMFLRGGLVFACLQKCGHDDIKCCSVGEEPCKVGLGSWWNTEDPPC